MPGMKGKQRDRAKMERLLARKRREGLTYEELADESGVPASTLARWGSRLGQGRAFVEVETVEEDDQEELELEAAGLEVLLDSGHRIAIGRDFDAATLKRLVDVLTC